mmetsp:Transcript_3152/g.12064  ORF Transcript_3152/g.12064 Transcript_3152/m.12064 type:complete len:236 (-) Transcript_3152:369-1076(-)
MLLPFNSLSRHSIHLLMLCRHRMPPDLSQDSRIQTILLDSLLHCLGVRMHLFHCLHGIHVHSRETGILHLCRSCRRPLCVEVVSDDRKSPVRDHHHCHRRNQMDSDRNRKYDEEPHPKDRAHIYRDVCGRLCGRSSHIYRDIHHCPSYHHSSPEEVGYICPRSLCIHHFCRSRILVDGHNLRILRRMVHICCFCTRRMVFCFQLERSSRRALSFRSLSSGLLDLCLYAVRSLHVC